MKLSRGSIIIQVIILSSIAAIFINGLIILIASNIKYSRVVFNRERAIHIAEAGIDYYRWHLAHAPTDYKDGTALPGPYTHSFKDKNGTVIGYFDLTITAPITGSTLVTVTSKGRVVADPAISRTIVTRLAKPSLAKYATVANGTMRFGEGTEVNGPIHSNGGIRFDGFAHNIVSSAVASYDDPDHAGGNEFGVHTHHAPVDPLPPNVPPSRSDVFQVGRQFPVPAVDFGGITSNLSQMKTDAQASGFYRAASGSLGYQVVLRTDDTFRLYRVTQFTNAPNGCTNVNNETGWSTWSLSNRQLIGTYPFPANGIIFLEDHVFVEGAVNTARLTIAAATFPDNPNTRKNIIINNDLSYSHFDGQDVIALIAQGNVNVGLVSDTDLHIDGALVAQNGRVGRHYYAPPGGGSNRCSPNHAKQTITLWGMIATNQRYGFAYTDGTGYTTRNINYDANLLYGPPPSFPLTSDQYVILSWEEVK